MLRPISAGLIAGVCALAIPMSFPEAQQGSGRRPLAIQDYYRIQTVGNPVISPDARWVTFTISNRVEEDNSTETETWVVGTDGTSKPTRVLHWALDDSSPFR